MDQPMNGDSVNGMVRVEMAHTLWYVCVSAVYQIDEKQIATRDVQDIDPKRILKCVFQHKHTLKHSNNNKTS